MDNQEPLEGQPAQIIDRVPEPRDAAGEDTRPQFEIARPTRRSQLALRAAGALIGAPKGVTGAEVLDHYATEVGGYTPGRTEGTYGHPDVKTDRVMSPVAQDETTRLSHEARMRNQRVYMENAGVMGLGGAVKRTVRGERLAPGRGNSVADRIAARLVRAATKKNTY